MTFIITQFTGIDSVAAIVSKVTEHIKIAPRIIIAVGDSFTAGDEIGEDILPGWPGLFIDGNQSASIRQQWMAKMATPEMLSSNLYRTILRRGAEKTWSAKIHNINPDWVVINDGKSGGSNDRSFRRVSEWILEVRRITSAPISLVIGLSALERFELWNKKTHSWVNIHPSYHFNNPFDKNPLYSDFRDVWINYFDDTYYCIDKSLSLLLAVVTLANYKKVQLITNHWFGPPHTPPISRMAKVISECTHLQTNLAEVDTLWYKDRLDDDEYLEERKFTVASHFSENIHARYADKVLQKILEHTVE